MFTLKTPDLTEAVTAVGDPEGQSFEPDVVAESSQIENLK